MVLRSMAGEYKRFLNLHDFIKIEIQNKVGIHTLDVDIMCTLDTDRI